MVIHEMLLARRGKQFVSSLKLNVNAFKKKKLKIVTGIDLLS